MAKTQSAVRRVTRAKAPPPVTPWPQVLGECALLAVAATVPLAINRNSQNLVDIKDVILGLGVVLGLALWLVAGLAQGRLSWVRSRLTLLIFLYVAWAGVSVLYSRYPWASATEYGHLLANIGFFCLALVSLRNAAQVRRIGLTICLIMMPIAFYAVAQATKHDFITWASANRVRVFSYLANPTYLGGFLMLVLPLLVALLWPEQEKEDTEGAISPPPALRVFQALAFAAVVIIFLLPCVGVKMGLVPMLCLEYVALAIALGAIYLTFGPAPIPQRLLRPALGVAIGLVLLSLYLSFTLAAFIGLGLGTLVALVLAVIRGGARTMRLAVLGLVVAAIVLGPTGLLVYRHMPASQQQRVQDVIHLKDPTAAERQLHWHVAAELFREHPVFGLGYGAFRLYSMKLMERAWYSEQTAPEDEMFMPAYAHNEYLQVLSDTGLIGGVLFAALLLTFYGMAFRVALRHPTASWRRLAVAGVVAGTAFLFQNSVGVTFRQSGASIFFWLWLAIVATAHASLPDGDTAEIAVPRLHKWQSRGSVPAAVASGLAAAGVLGVLCLIVIPPTIADTTLKEARALAAAGRLQEAEAAAQATVELCPYSGFGYYTLAYAAGKLGDYQEAADANLKALQLSPDNASMYYNLGVSYRSMGKLDEAQRAFQKAVDLMPVGEHYLGLADVALARGQFDEAERYVAKGLKSEPQNESLLQAKVLIAQRQASAAAPKTLEQVRAAVQEHPDSPVLQHQLAGLLLAQKNYREAIAPARRWAQLDASSPEAEAAVGVCAFNLEQYAEARQAFTRAIALRPSYLSAHLDLAKTYVRLHLAKEALQELKTVAGTGGDTPEGKEARAMLAKYGAVLQHLEQGGT